MTPTQTELVPEQALQRHEAQPLSIVSGVNVESLLAKAIDGKAAVEILERLMVMRREARAEHAKEAFDAALASFQSECPVIVKRRAGAKDAYRYAPLDAIVSETKGLIQKHGFSYGVSSVIEQGWVKAICRIKHNTGHEEISEFKVPVDDKNPMMTAPQRYGGAMTFAKRYAFCNAFGILTADEDLDAASRPKPAGPSTLAPDSPELKALARQLWDLLKDVRGTAKNWGEANQWLIKNDIIGDAEQAPHFTPDKFREVITKSKIALGVA